MSDPAPIGQPGADAAPTPAADPLSSAPLLSVIMPAYNEEAVIRGAVEEVHEWLFAHVPSSELIVVNDGSTDQTGAILEQCARSDDRIRVIQQPNSGHGAALLNGLGHARGQLLLLADSDRQIPLAAFPRLWEQVSTHDAVFGVRAHRNDPTVRLVLSAVIRLTVLVFFRVWLRDPNVPFKILRRSAWLSVAPLIPPDTLAPSLFAAIALRRQGARILEVEVPHRPRATASTLSVGRLGRFCTRALGQLIAFWWRIG